MKPGKTEELKVVIKAKSRPGTISKTVNVTTNDPKNPKVRLTCKGKVLVPFKVAPASIRFQRIERGSPAVSKKVTITRGDGGPLSLAVLPIDHPSVKVSLVEIEPGEKYELETTLTPPWPAKSIRAVLWLTTGVKESPKNRITLIADIEPRVKAVPARIDVPSGLSKEQKVVVQVNWLEGEGEYKLVGASSNDAKIKARIDNGDGKHKVIVTIPAGYKRTAKSAAITIRTNDKQTPTLRVPVRIKRNPHRDIKAKKTLKRATEKGEKKEKKADSPTGGKHKHEHKKDGKTDCGGGTEDGVGAAPVARPAAPGTTATWSCTEPIVKHEPIWTGKPAVFTFNIGNNGTADLQIKAKGG